MRVLDGFRAGVFSPFWPLGGWCWVFGALGLKPHGFECIVCVDRAQRGFLGRVVEVLRDCGLWDFNTRFTLPASQATC